MGKLQLKIDGNDFTGVLADNPVIKDQLNACCRTLTFKLSLYGNRLDLLAHKVELFYKGKRWFIGEIKKQKEEHDGTNSITAYDPLFLFGKHEDDYYFKNQTATQIVKSMAKKIGLKVYKLENTKVVISYVLYKKGAPDKITVDVLARTWKGGGDKFWFRYDPINDGILLKRRTVPEMIWAFKTGGNLISASRERSIEEMYNTVKLINRETGKTATKVNAKNKALYGNTQYYEEISDKDKNLSKLAEQKLKSLSKITSTMNMSGLNSDGAMGQFFVGDPIYVEEKNTGMVGGYWVRNVSHTFLADDAIQLDFDLSWAWCACTWSAAAIKLGYTPIMPIEISCYYLIEAAKKKGIWIENDAHVPKVGEGVLYYWKDGTNFATTDCTGVPDHVGTVTEVYEKAGYFVVTEGNYSDAVKKRTMLINGRYIRGFISPKYTDDTVTPVTPAAGKDLTTVAREVILGVWGNMPERKTKLEASGYNFTDVQNKVNELLNKNVPTPSKPQNTGVTKVVAGSGAASFDKSLAGSYVTTTGLYMRHGAGKNKRAMVLIPEGTKVQNYGYYTSYNGTKWLYIQVTLNGVQYTGFSCKTYLKKQ